LGIPGNASDQDIQDAYRRLLQKLHTAADAAPNEELSEVIEAYNVLSDGKKRAEYDRSNNVA
jgi:molecular chaperone DnaJ